MTENMTTSFKYGKTKKRNWTFVLYPESAPDNWRDILQQTGLEIAISPLHDSDRDPTGDLKKPHYHIILCYNNTVTGRMVKSLVDDLNQPIPMPIDSVKGLYRYFTHKDNPDKYQYSENDIMTLNGFDILDFSDLSTGDKSKIRVELVKFIKENDIDEYSDFIDKIIEIDKPDFLLVAMTSTIFFNAYLCSKRHKQKDGDRVEYVFIDKDTGEVVEDSKEEPKPIILKNRR